MKIDTRKMLTRLICSILIPVGWRMAYLVKLEIMCFLLIAIGWNMVYLDMLEAST